MDKDFYVSPISYDLPTRVIHFILGPLNYTARMSELDAHLLSNEV